MYTISTLESKKIDERIFFYNAEDDRSITIIVAWSGGEVYSDDNLELDDYDEQEGTVVPCDQGENLVDNWHSRVEGDVNDEEEANAILEAWQEDLESGVEELGWSWSDREIWFYGPLEVAEDDEG